jgi:hypothetical protein
MFVKRGDELVKCYYDRALTDNELKQLISNIYKVSSYNDSQLGTFFNMVSQYIRKEENRKTVIYACCRKENVFGISVCEEIVEVRDLFRLEIPVFYKNDEDYGLELITVDFPKYEKFSNKDSEVLSRLSALVETIKEDFVGKEEIISIIGKLMDKKMKNFEFRNRFKEQRCNCEPDESSSNDGCHKKHQ